MEEASLAPLFRQAEPSRRDAPERAAKVMLKVTQPGASGAASRTAGNTARTAGAKPGAARGL